MIQWEYKIHFPQQSGCPAISEELNFLGSLGWELVSIIVGEDGQYRYYFKRPVGHNDT